MGIGGERRRAVELDEADVHALVQRLEQPREGVVGSRAAARWTDEPARGSGQFRTSYASRGTRLNSGSRTSWRVFPASPSSRPRRPAPDSSCAPARNGRTGRRAVRSSCSCSRTCRARFAPRSFRTSRRPKQQFDAGEFVAVQGEGQPLQSAARAHRRQDPARDSRRRDSRIPRRGLHPLRRRGRSTRCGQELTAASRASATRTFASCCRRTRRASTPSGSASGRRRGRSITPIAAGCSSTS